jgi:hypothetical protein
MAPTISKLPQDKIDETSKKYLLKSLSDDIEITEVIASFQEDGRH